MSKITCEDCEGEGVWEWHSIIGQAMVIECDKCKGTGEVDDKSDDGE